jgi:regulator of sigma E protease
MMTVVYAAIAFGILIFFHELGHFLMAKAMGIRVLTFALGFGSKLLKFRWRGTEYAICAVPLGGYVKMMGEEPDEEVAAEEMTHAFSAQPVAKRFLIVLAGPVFNLLLAVIIVWFLYWGDVPILSTGIQNVIKGSPAAEAGIEPGDRVVAIDGQEVDRWQQVLEKVMNSEGAELEITVNRKGTLKHFSLRPAPRQVVSRYGDKIKLWQIGITSTGEVSIEHFGPGSALVEAGNWTWSKAVFTLQTLGRLIVGKESIKNIGSPLLIGMEAGKQAEMGLSSYFSFIAFISVILAIMNLLPIPVLDGGHLFFFAVEAVIRRPVSSRVRGVAQYVGLALLICIMAWAIYRDLDRLYYWKTKQESKPGVEAPQGREPSP